MNKSSSNLVHRFNNQFVTLVTSLEAINSNIENLEYLKEILPEIMEKKDEFYKTLIEVREVLEMNNA